ncbi:hypothetical protein [Streptomyces sp. NPDC048825]|uniref:hypothetical protein n=1 Tax=Streptomyces sp. NPDC048825 TaxID=3365592 RepID=UPI0037227343
MFSGFQDSGLGQPLELQAGVVDVVGGDLQVHRLAHLPRSQRRVGRGEHCHDLLAGRMVRQLRGQRRGRLRIGRLQQCLAGDPDLLGGRPSSSSRAVSCAICSLSSRPAPRSPAPAPPAAVADFAEEHKDWLRIFQMPSCAPELNAVEGIWSLLKWHLGDFAVADLARLTRVIKRKLKKIQYRLHLIDGCLPPTGLIEPQHGSCHRRSPLTCGFDWAKHDDCHQGGALSVTSSA